MDFNNQSANELTNQDDQETYVYGLIFVFLSEFRVLELFCELLRVLD